MHLPPGWLLQRTNTLWRLWRQRLHSHTPCDGQCDGTGPGRPFFGCNGRRDSLRRSRLQVAAARKGDGKTRKPKKQVGAPSFFRPLTPTRACSAQVPARPLTHL